LKGVTKKGLLVNYLQISHFKLALGVLVIYHNNSIHCTSRAVFVEIMYKF